jgi:ribose 5-phosphate isomerase A
MSKELVAKELVKRLKNGETIGVGTGSTVDACLTEISKRVIAEKLVLQVVPTSYESAWKCQQIGLTVLQREYRGDLAWGFDGADEVDPNRWLIKGKGGAMLMEKILAAKCKQYVVVVDDSKLVTSLGQKCPVPVEVIPGAVTVVERGLAKLGAREINIRRGTGIYGPVISECGNIILDVTFPKIEQDLERQIKSIVGVVESGLFIGYATEILVAGKDGVVVR